MNFAIAALLISSLNIAASAPIVSYNSTLPANTTVPSNGTVPVNGTIPFNGTLPTNGTVPINGTVPLNTTVPHFVIAPMKREVRYENSTIVIPPKDSPIYRNATTAITELHQSEDKIVTSDLKDSLAGLMGVDSSDIDLDASLEELLEKFGIDAGEDF